MAKVSDDAKRLEKLKNLQAQYSILPTVKAYLEFEAMNPADKAKLRQEWDEYYLKIQDNTPAKASRAALQAFKVGNTAKVKKIIHHLNDLKAKGEIKYIVTPSQYDPQGFNHLSDITAYKHITEKIAEIQGNGNGVLDFASKLFHQPQA